MTNEGVIGALLRLSYALDASVPNVSAMTIPHARPRLELPEPYYSALAVRKDVMPFLVGGTQVGIRIAGIEIVRRERRPA